ncbi:MAG: TA system VapC family ribonuclease toxin, partial [Bryobacteraceae bacterium]
WWQDTLSGPRTVGLAWVTILGFVRISTHRGASPIPVFPAEATGRVRTWLQNPRVQIVTPGEGHAEILFELLDKLGTAGNLTTDAHLAALAIEYQAEIASTDNDFARFKGLRWFNPIRV